MKHYFLILLVGTAGILIGCGDSKTPASSTTAGGSVAQNATNGSDPQSPKTDAGGSTSTKADPTQPSASTPPKPLSAALMNDAYAYDGFANSQPMDYTLQISSQKKLSTGSVIFHQQSVTDGSAEYHVERTGDLGTTFGNDDMVLQPDGAYITKNSLITIAGKNLDFPAKVGPGTTWDSKVKGQSDSGGVSESIHFSVVGNVSYTAKNGSKYTALKVLGSGETTLNHTQGHLTSQALYVKNIGMVYNQYKAVEKGKPPLTITMEWAPPKSGEKS